MKKEEKLELLILIINQRNLINYKNDKQSHLVAVFVYKNI